MVNETIHLRRSRDAGPDAPGAGSVWEPREVVFRVHARWEVIPAEVRGVEASKACPTFHVRYVTVEWISDQHAEAL